MKTARKLLVTLLVLTFVLGTMSFGFAAPAEEAVLDVNKLVSDIEDKDVKDAVRRLNAFGIIDGMEDGKYHPETKLTREQFAKILVTSLKMDHAAKAGAGYKTFTDVAADRWSAGYIGVASGQGLIKGYPDGTFKPAQEVTYAEAVTMLVRALGYKDEFLPGTWPGNYLAKGAEKDITKKVKFTNATGVVNRADAALLVNNTLDAKVVKVDEYDGSNIKYKESNLTLLEDKFNVEKLEDTRIVATKRLDDGLKWNEVKVEDKTYKLVKNFNPEPILGEEVTVYVNDDDEVVYAESENDDKVNFDYVEEIVNDKLSLVKFDDDYPFAKNAYVFMKDGDKVRKIDVDDYDVFLGKVGKFVVNNNKIVWAEVMELEAEPWFIVMKNDDGLLTGICADDDEYEIDLRKGEDFDDVIVLDIDGNEVKIKDIDKGNLLYVQKQEIDGDDYAVVRVVKNNVVEGKLDRVEDKKVKIGDKNLKVVNYVSGSDKQINAYYSIDDGDEIKQYLLKNEDVQGDMEDADEEEVIAYTDAVGRVAYFETSAKSASGYRYGIVTKIYSDKDRIKVYTVNDKGEGDEIIYTMEEEKNVEAAFKLDKFGRKVDEPEVVAITEGSPIKFKLNKDGEIAEDKIYVLDTKDAWRINAADDFGRDYLPTATHFSDLVYSEGAPANIDKAAGAEEKTASFSVNDNVVIIDAKTYKFDSSLKPVYDSSEFDPANWKDLAKANGMDGFFYVFADDNNPYEAKAVIFIDKGSGAASDDEMPIYVIKKWMKGGDEYVSYHAYDGQIEERVLDNKLYAGKEHPYVAKIKANGKLEIIAKDKAKDFDIYYGQVEKKDASSITMKKVFNYKDGSEVSQNIFNISSKTLVYEEDSKKTTSSLKANDIVIFIVEKGSNVRVVERLIDDEFETYNAKINPPAGE